MEGEDSLATRKETEREGKHWTVSVHREQADRKEKYVVKGQDSEGSFEALRQAKDFYLARKLLIAQWPGLFLPTIKAKYSEIRQSREDASERKRAALEAFLTHIMDIPCLLHCETMRLFLFAGPNFHKSLGNLKTASFQSISEDFLRSFSPFIKETTADLPAQLAKELNLLQLALSQAIKMKQLAKELTGFFVNLQDSGERLNCCFENYESDVVSECARSEPGNYRPVFKRIVREASGNPYFLVWNWAKSEELAICAMLEALQAPKYLRSELERLETKRRSDTRAVEKLQAGKFTLGALLSLRTKAANILELEANLRWVRAIQMDSEIAALHRLLPVVETRLLESEIPRFSSLHQASFQTLLRDYSFSACSQWEEVRPT